MCNYVESQVPQRQCPVLTVFNRSSDIKLVHELKCSPSDFDLYEREIKTFYVSDQDIKFEVGDIINFRESSLGIDTGRLVRVKIKYIQKFSPFDGNFAILSLEVIGVKI